MPEERVVATPQEIPDSDADCIAHFQQIACWKNLYLFDLAKLRGCVSPNPPVDTYIRREDTGRGVRELQAR